MASNTTIDLLLICTLVWVELGSSGLGLGLLINCLQPVSQPGLDDSRWASFTHWQLAQVLSRTTCLSSWDFFSWMAWMIIFKKRYRQCSKKASLMYKDSSSSCWYLPFWGPIDDGNSRGQAQSQCQWWKLFKSMVTGRDEPLGSTSVMLLPLPSTQSSCDFWYLREKCSPGVSKAGFSLSLSLSLSLSIYIYIHTHTHTHTHIFSFLAHRLSCSVAYEIFPDRGSNPCLLHW